MSRRPDTPCILCGRLTWSSGGGRSSPSDRRVCRRCRIEHGLPPRGAMPAAFFEQLVGPGMNYRPVPTLRAMLPAIAAPSQTSRAVSVVDPTHGVVEVLWSLDRTRMWSCGIHGDMSAPGCVHTQAAASALASALLGVVAGITVVVDRDGAPRRDSDPLDDAGGPR